MRTLIALLASAFLVACPSSAPSDDAGSTDAGSEGHRDAGAPLDGGVLDAGDEEDAGDDEAGAPEPDDAGAASDGGEDVDGGFVCTLPPFQPPPSVDAGAPDCSLVGIEGALGRFEGKWDGTVFGSFPLTGPFELPARGDMAFEIYCGADKLLVDGILDGRAYQHPDAGPEEPGHPFSGRLYGEYDLESGVITMVVKPATLTVGAFSGTFEVSMVGFRSGDEFEDGEWCGYTTVPAGGFGGGTWRAGPG